MDDISIAIVDDDVLLVSLLKDYLSKQNGIEVSFTADSGEAFLDQMTKKYLPDVVLMDLKMKRLNGARVAELLKQKYPQVRSIIMSSHYKKSFMGFMLKTGASAFIPKGVYPEQVLDVIKGVHKKGYYFMSDQMDVIRDEIIHYNPKSDNADDGKLTTREIEVLRMICFQKTAKEIGDELFITKRTVEGHKSNLFIKTGAKNIAGLVIFAIQNGYVRADDVILI